MAKKKKRTRAAKPRRKLEVPEKARRAIWGVAMFVVALIFLFAFFDKGGAAGAFLFDAGTLLVGRVAYLIPVVALLAGLVLFMMQSSSVRLPLASSVLALAGASAMVGVVARNSGGDPVETAGYLGSLVSWPLFVAFGFWVGEIIGLALLVSSGLLFWYVLPHPREKDSFADAAEKVKKVFEPKFEVKDVEEHSMAPPVTVETERRQAVKAEPEPRPAFAASSYKAPSLDLLEQDNSVPNAGDVRTFSAIIKKTLANFDIPVEISEVNIGPAVTQYAFKPAEGIKLSRIVGLQNDLALSLAAHPIRIEAPIPGKSLVGVEIPNRVRAVVHLRNLVENPEFQKGAMNLPIALGRDVSGQPVFTDLARMPHLLVAGSTGSGKTIGLNNVILSLVWRHGPDSLRLVLVDPKRVEFPVYNDLPHLLTPVILDSQRTINILKWCIKEMERRFEVLSSVKARDIASYHAVYEGQLAKKQGEVEAVDMEQLPYLVVVIDELADLMVARGKEVEGMVVRLAQMARATGIHLVLATQRPSVEVITGLIKANMPSRVAFQVASQVDSRTILDAAGAEKLLGKGDMLFVSSEFSEPRRVQGAFVSDKDVKKVVSWIAKENGAPEGQITQDELSQSAGESMEAASFDEEDQDPMYEEAKQLVVESKKASASFLQRRLKVGYARAARLLDMMEERGVVGPADGAKPREIYAVSSEEGWVSPKVGEE